jgi:hypothetical protein
MKVYKAPEIVDWELNPMSVFTAGSKFNMMRNKND